MNDRSDAAYLAYVDGRASALRRVAYLLSGDADQADELVQETITKLYARWPRIGAVANVDAYVHTMMVRVTCPARTWRRSSTARTAP
jgi:DNA-directed RNA polymerase specialized sigma24 family protein